MRHITSSLDTQQSFPCSWEGKKMLSVSWLLSSSEMWTVGDDVGWNTSQSLSSSSSLLPLIAVFPPLIVGPTWPVNWLSKLKMTVPGLWTWTGPTERRGESKEWTDNDNKSGLLMFINTDQTGTTTSQLLTVAQLHLSHFYRPQVSQMFHMKVLISLMSTQIGFRKW